MNQLTDKSIYVSRSVQQIIIYLLSEKQKQLGQ